MLDCRYYDLCCFTDDSCNGEPECPKRDHCQFYSPMPDVGELAKLADKLESEGLEGWASGPVNVGEFARRIRETLGIEDDRRR